MRKPRSAVFLLDEAVKNLAGFSIPATQFEIKAWAAYRRALRALLKERAEAAAEASDQWCNGVGRYETLANLVRAAVLKGRT